MMDIAILVPAAEKEVTTVGVVKPSRHGVGVCDATVRARPMPLERRSIPPLQRVRIVITAVPDVEYECLAVAKYGACNLPAFRIVNEGPCCGTDYLQEFLRRCHLYDL